MDVRSVNFNYWLTGTEQVFYSIVFDVNLISLHADVGVEYVPPAHNLLPLLDGNRTSAMTDDAKPQQEEQVVNAVLKYEKIKVGCGFPVILCNYSMTENRDL